MEEITKPIAYRSYITLTKPGIIMGNLITMTAGFGLASSFSLTLFVLTAFGLSLIIASACVWNNILDRHHDGKMERTKNRPLVTKAVSVRQAVIFAAVLLLLGVLVLLTYTNPLTTAVALMGLLIYVIPYSLLKYLTVHATLIGSIAGAVPPLVGFCACENHLSLAPLLFFGIVLVWQMPHFFAIALYRLDDYRKAKVPILPLIRGVSVTKIQMLFYIIAFGILSCSLTQFTSKAYLAIALAISVVWVIFSLFGFKAKDERLWARKMFLFSLVAVMGLSVSVFL